MNQNERHDECDPYAEGADAYLAGVSELSNPYDASTQEESHLAWNDGWLSAQAQGDEGEEEADNA